MHHVRDKSLNGETLDTFHFYTHQLNNMLSTQVFEENTRLQQKIQRSIDNHTYVLRTLSQNCQVLFCDVIYQINE